MNRKSLSRLIKFVVMLLLCWYAIPRACTTARFAGQIHKPSLNRELSGVASLLPEGEARSVRLHLGLPNHNGPEMKAFLWSVWAEPTVTFHGYSFYKKIWSPEKAFVSEVANLLKSSSSFSPYSDGKACGGFHPDFIIRFEHGNIPIEMIVCTTCGEVLIFSQGQKGMVDLSARSYEQLQLLWETVRKGDVER